MWFVNIFWFYPGLIPSMPFSSFTGLPLPCLISWLGASDNTQFLMGSSGCIDNGYPLVRLSVSTRVKHTRNSVFNPEYLFSAEGTNLLQNFPMDIFQRCLMAFLCIVHTLNFNAIRSAGWYKLSSRAINLHLDPYSNLLALRVTQEWIRAAISSMAYADSNTQRVPKGRRPNNLLFTLEGMSHCAHMTDINTITEGVLVYHCCATHCHKFSGLKQHIFIILQFLWFRSPGMALLGSFQAAIQVWLTQVSLKAWWEDLLPSSLRWLLEFLSIQLYSWVLIFLLAFS